MASPTRWRSLHHFQIREVLALNREGGPLMQVQEVQKNLCIQDILMH